MKRLSLCLALSLPSVPVKADPVDPKEAQAAMEIAEKLDAEIEKTGIEVEPMQIESKIGVSHAYRKGRWRIRSGRLNESSAPSFSGAAGDDFRYATQKLPSGWILGVRWVKEGEGLWFLQAPDSETFVERMTHAKMHLTGMAAPVPVTLITMKNGTARIDAVKRDAGTLSFKIGMETIQFDITGAQGIADIVSGRKPALPEKPKEKPALIPPP